MTINNNKHGFTLIELAIVLVIVGLLVGGVLQGKELIEQSKVTATVTQLSQISSALNTFRAKYNGLAGDITKAYMFFGSACGTNGDVNSSAANCNGNGNRVWGDSGACTATGFSEGFRAWQHLNLSGIYPGNFTGITTAYPVAGQHFPEGKYGSQTGYSLFNKHTCWGSSAPAGNLIHLGKISTGGYYYTREAMITPTSASQIDAKLDDGLPTSGLIYSATATPYSGTECISSGAYNFASDVDGCTIDFIYR